MEKEDEIRLIAYRIWEEEGYMHGHDFEHWIRAESIWVERNKPDSGYMNKKIEAKSGPFLKQTPKKKKINKKS